MTDKEIEDTINSIARERNIKIEYPSEKTVRVSSPELTLVGCRDVFDKAMREVALKKKSKQ